MLVIFFYAPPNVLVHFCNDPPGKDALYIMIKCPFFNVHFCMSIFLGDTRILIPSDPPPVINDQSLRIINQAYIQIGRKAN